MQGTDDCCTLIHISDLHLRYPLTAAGRKLKKKLGIKTHSYHYLVAASDAIRRINFECSRTLLLNTGDCTTLGDPTSFDLSRQVMESQLVSWEEIQHDVGMGFGDKYFVVPGNHDRYDEAPWEFQYTNFEEEYRSLLPTANFQSYGVILRNNWEHHHRRLPQIRVIRSADRKVCTVVIGLDSTVGMNTPNINILKQVARGHVADDEIGFVENVMADVHRGRLMLSTGERINLSGARVFVIVALHHHPYLPSDVDPGFFTELINARDLIERCRKAGVNMMVYGHQHVAFVDSVTFGAQTTSPSQLICAASASLSVHEESSHSFNVYYVDTKHVGYELWEYQRGIFRQSDMRGEFAW